MEKKDFLKLVSKIYEDKFEQLKVMSKDGSKVFNVAGIKVGCPRCGVSMYWNSPRPGDVQACKQCYFEFKCISINPFKIELTEEWASFQKYWE